MNFSTLRVTFADVLFFPLRQDGAAASSFFACQGRRVYVIVVVFFAVGQNLKKQMLLHPLQRYEEKIKIASHFANKINRIVQIIKNKLII